MRGAYFNFLVTMNTLNASSRPRGGAVSRPRPHHRPGLRCVFVFNVLIVYEMCTESKEFEMFKVIKEFKDYIVFIVLIALPSPGLNR
jgi:hypothetical protein